MVYDQLYACETSLINEQQAPISNLGGTVYLYCSAQNGKPFCVLMPLFTKKKKKNIYF